MMFEMVLRDTTPADDSGAAVQLNETAPVPYAASGLRNPFPPIADYAFLSDCENTYLISSSGSVEWLCVPGPIPQRVADDHPAGVGLPGGLQEEIEPRTGRHLGNFLTPSPIWR